MLYGDGSGLSNISADGIDVTSSAGNLAYNLVFTEGAQTDGSLGLGLNTNLNYNPGTGLISSSAGAQFVQEAIFGGTLHATGAISGAVGLQGQSLTVGNGGLQVSDDADLSSSAGMEIVGNTVLVGTLNVTGAQTLGGAVSSSAGAVFVQSLSSSANVAVTGNVHAATYYGDGSNLTGVDSASGSARQYSATGMETSGYLKVSGSTTLAGALSSSAGAQVVGNVLLGGQLGISGGIQFQVTTVTTNTHLTASTATTYQVVSGGTAAITMMLPSASAGEHYQYAIKRHALMSGNVVITGSDVADVIDGEARLELETAGASVFLISDGTQWNIF
jgi:hypothetical protein